MMSKTDYKRSKVTTDGLPIANDRQHRALGLFFGPQIQGHQPQDEVRDDIANEREQLKATLKDMENKRLATILAAAQDEDAAASSSAPAPSHPAPQPRLELKVSLSESSESEAPFKRPRVVPPPPAKAAPRRPTPIQRLPAKAAPHPPAKAAPRDAAARGKNVATACKTPAKAPRGVISLLARTWQEHGNNRACAGQKHGNHMARAWQEHGKDMA